MSLSTPKWRTRLLMAAGILLMLVFAAYHVNAGVSASSVPRQTMHALVHQPAGQISETQDLQVHATYPAFTLVEATTDALSQLEDDGVSVQYLPNRTHIVLSTGAFCTQEGEPDFANSLRSDPAPGHTAYYLLQFIGPVKGEWISSLEAQGVEFMEYVPNYAYVVKGTSETLQGAADRSEVQWTGAYHPGYRVSPTVLQALSARGGTSDQEYVVEFYGGQLPDGFPELLKAAGLDNLELTTVGGYPDDQPRYRMLVEGRLASLFSLVSNTGFSYLAPMTELQLFNHEARHAIGTAAAHSHELTGKGQIVAVTDSGLDASHEMFHDPDYTGDGPGLPWPWPFDSDLQNSSGQSFPWPWPNPGQPSFGPDHRKVEAFIDLSNDWFATSGDPIGHGTHVAGTIAGDAAPHGEWNKYDGHAYEARLVVIKAFTSMGSWGAGFDFYSVFEEAARAGASIDNHSWGGKSSDMGDGYGTVGRDADRFMADYPSNLMVIASGNFGDDSGETIATPGDAKNVLTVGAVSRANPEDVMSFSSRGPTADGRLKPDLVAPGSPIASAAADTTDRYRELQGTSMSTPTAAGAAALVRQYYTDGFYPAGTAGSGAGFEPSSALIKATLLCGAREIAGENSDQDDQGTYPNSSQGWGLLDLDGSLYWPGDARTMQVWDDPTSLATGDVWEETIYIGDGSEPLHLHLAWTDPAPAQGAQEHLVNDLNLELVAPDATVFRGNNLTGRNPGYTVAQGQPDTVNNNEGIRLLPGLSTPGDLPEGEYTIRVVGGNVPAGPQSFALVVRGGMTDEPVDPPPAEDKVEVTMKMDMDVWMQLQEEIEAYGELEGVELIVTMPRE